MSGLHISIVGENNKIEFGENVIVNASINQPTVINAGGGKRIIIGCGALFSNNIEIHTTDYHGIYNKNGERINQDKDIVIAEYVWVGLGCKILKGSVLSAGSIVGAGTIISGAFLEENVVIAGCPARIIRHQVFWKGARKDSYPVPEVLKAKWEN